MYNYVNLKIFTMKKLFSAALALVIATLSIALSSPVFAASIVISPPKLEVNAERGQTLNEVIKITNRDKTTINLTSSVQDFVPTGESGKAAFINPEDNDPSLSIANWITIEDVSIKPGEKKAVPFTINVPNDAEPGGHYGAIFFSPPTERGAMPVQQRIGVLVLIRVEGEINESGQLDTFGIYPEDLEGEDIIDNSSDFFFSSLPVPFATRVENTGNVHMKPAGKVEISSIFGKVSPIGVESILSDTGVVMNEEIVNYLPVNNQRGNVLSKSFRTFRSTWQGEPYWYYNEDGTKEIKYKGSPIGIYTAKLTLDILGEEVIEEVTFIVFPWQKVLGGGAVIALLIFGFIRYRKWNEKRLEEKYKKKFGKK